jgi:hypothetical protein
VAYINSDLLGQTINQVMCSPLYLKHIRSAQMLALGPQVA